MSAKLPIAAVTCFLLREGKLLLQERPASKVWGRILNGPGGKIETGESAEEAIVREVQEETGLTLRAFEPRGRVCLSIPFPSPLLLNVDIFVATDVSGCETEREGRLSWHDRHSLPFDRMWADQRYWLPAVLDGFSVQADIRYEE